MASLVTGNVIRFSIEIRTQADALYDPEHVAFRLQSPSGVAVRSATISKNSTGKYHVDVKLTEAGRWRYGWQILENGVETRDEGAVTIEQSVFGD
jgi:uncharacterized protein YfaS (alpha-2-macroglobulin family)